MRTPFMRSRLQQALLGLIVLSAPSLHAASFVYEGQLDDRGAPANGRYDIELAVYGDAELGATLSAPLVFNAVEVVGGRFRLDFEAALESGESAWVQLAVREAGSGGFSTIPGRTKASQAPAAIGACWSSVGDSGSNPATHFLGTTDVQPLVLRTGNAQSLRLEPSALLSGGLPITANVIAGSSANNVTSGVRGATVSGGGAPVVGDPEYLNLGPNHVSDHYGSIGGGSHNYAGDGAGSLGDRPFATIGGGGLNNANGTASNVAGGLSNLAKGEYSSIAGGYSNTASGTGSIVAGGTENTASGPYATVGSGLLNCAGGGYSLALGTQAKIRPGTDAGTAGTGCAGVPLSGDALGDAGTFVWADGLGGAFSSTGDNQFLVRATGGVGINGAPPANAANELSIFGTTDFSGFANFFMRQNQSDRGGILISVGEASSNANNAGLYIDQFRPEAAPPNQLRRLELDTSGRLRVYVDNPIKPTAGSWAAPSDARLKHHVVPLQGSLERLLALHGVSYQHNADAPSAYFTPGAHTGFIAQEVQKVFPNWVSTDSSGYLMLGPQGFEAIAVEALRELRNEGTLIAAAQADEIRALKQELAELRKLIQPQRNGDR